MDFYSLSRRELQALCKRNKIPANITNVAMADALKALDFVEGLEDALIMEKTSVDSPTKTEIKQSIPRTSCRTSTRRKPIKEEPQTMQISTRTRGGLRRAVAGRVEDNNNAAAPLDLVRRKMESQLKEAAEDDNKWVETPSAASKIGTTSVREGYSTRRSTRLLEKKMIGMNLDDDDDDQIVERDAAQNEELVVFDKGMEVEGINQQKTPSDFVEKTDVVDEKPAVLLEDSFMGDNEEDSLKVELQQTSKAFDELEKTDVSDDKPAVLLEDSFMGDNEEKSLKVELQQISVAFDELEKTDVSDEKPVLLEDSLMGNNEEDSLKVELQQISKAFDELEKTDVSDEKPSVLLEDSLMGDNKEDSLKVKLQQISKDELEDHEDVDAEVFDESKGYLESELTRIESHTDGAATAGLVLENEEGLNAEKELKDASSDQFEIDQEAYRVKDIIVPVLGEEKSEGNFSPNQQEYEESLPLIETVADFIETIETGPEESMKTEVTHTSERKFKAEVSSVDDEVREDLTERPTGLPSEETIAFQNGCEKKVGINEEISDINKENFVKENIEKVNKDTKDLSIRQLRKMLKQMQITDKNTDSKETEKISKMGRARAALQPLSDNCLTTNKIENGN